MPNGGGLGGGMAQKQQLARGQALGVLRAKVGVQATEEEAKRVLAQQGLGESKRQLSRQGQLGGQVGRGRSLQRESRQLGRGLGNRSLGRFRRPL
mgnify:FL=1